MVDVIVDFFRMSVCRLTMRAADLVVRAALEPPSRRGAFFRFVSWFSHQAANAGRWALAEFEKLQRGILCITDKTAFFLGL